ncbi:MAG: hypothetical protein EXR99_05940 [Gemmataceae bacterium]|nr:hypothetical protein [Gemmataceae bacterium]
MTSEHSQKPNVELTDIDVKSVVYFGVSLAVVVALSYWMMVHVYEYLTGVENARKVSQYPLGQKLMEEEEGKVRAGMISDAENEALLVHGYAKKSAAEKKQFLATSKEVAQKREEINRVIQLRQDNRIFTTGLLRPPLPGEVFQQADRNLYEQGTSAAASFAAEKAGVKSRIVVSRLEGIDPLRPLMSGISNLPTYGQLTNEIATDRLKEKNIGQAMKNFSKRYMEENASFHKEQGYKVNEQGDYTPSDSSAGRKPRGTER